MKILYVSDAFDERSVPGADTWVFRAHTHCLEIDQQTHRYNYHDYFPDRDFDPWARYKNDYVTLVGDKSALKHEVDERGESQVYNSAWEPCEYFGVNRIENLGVQFNQWCLMSEKERVEGDWYHEYYKSCYTDLNEPYAKRINALMTSHHVIDNALVFLSYSPLYVARINDKLETEWQRDFINEDSRYTKDAIYPYRNSIITRVGELPDTDIRSQLMALDITTGETLWQLDCAFGIDYFILIGDRVYVSSRDNWVWCVVNADTGEVILEGQAAPAEECENYGWLWADSGYLFLNYQYDMLRIMDESSGEIIQDIPMPEGFVIDSEAFPEIRQDHIYFRLGSTGAHLMCTYGGVMILPRKELQQGLPLSLELEDKGAISHRAVDDDDGQHYEIDVAYEELGDVLRFGQIEIRIVAQKHSYNLWGNLDDDWKTRINKHFNGRIVFNIKRSALTNPDEDKLDLMVKLFNQHFKEEKFRAPANKKTVTLTWQYV